MKALKDCQSLDEYNEQFEPKPFPKEHRNMTDGQQDQFKRQYKQNIDMEPQYPYKKEETCKNEMEKLLRDVLNKNFKIIELNIRLEIVNPTDLGYVSNLNSYILHLKIFAEEFKNVNHIKRMRYLQNMISSEIGKFQELKITIPNL